MIDANALVMRWISEELGTDRVWSPQLPGYDNTTGAGFQPEDGPGIVVSVVNEKTHPEIPLVKSSVRIDVWADVGQGDIARERYLEVRDMIHGRTNVDFDVDGHVLSCLEESNQDLTDPDVGWARVESVFELELRAN